MTATIKRPDVAHGSDRRRHRTWWLTAAVLVLGVAVIALASVLWSDSDDSAAMPAEVEGAVNDYIAAALALDSAAWLETITDDWVQTRYYFAPDTQERIDTLDFESEESAYYVRILDYGATPVEYEQFGEPLVTGDGPWYVTMRQLFRELPHQDAAVLVQDLGNMTYVVVERDGQYKVAAEVWTGTEAVLGN